MDVLYRNLELMFQNGNWNLEKVKKKFRYLEIGYVRYWSEI